MLPFILSVLHFFKFFCLNDILSDTQRDLHIFIYTYLYSYCTALIFAFFFFTVVFHSCDSRCTLPANVFLYPFLCVQVRRWMRNPKVSVEKAQGKGLLCACPKCPLTEDLWYTHFPSPYCCCHYSGLQGGQYYHQEPCSPCAASGTSSGHEKSKGFKVMTTFELHERCLTSVIHTKRNFMPPNNTHFSLQGKRNVLKTIRDLKDSNK